MSDTNTWLPPSDLTTTNRVPTNVELATARKHIAQLDGDLLSLRSKIMEAEAYLQTLKDKEQLICDRRLPLENIVSPMRRIPEDIIRVIFSACLEPDYNPNMSCRTAPVLLTRISSDLRRVALTTPRLWAAVHIPLIMYQRTEDWHQQATLTMSARKRGLQEWLQRSGQLPLRISVSEIHQGGLPNMTLECLSKEILDIVVGCCARWEDISISVDTNLSRSLITSLQSLTAGDTPWLRGLHLSIRRQRGSKITPLLLFNTVQRINGISYTEIISPESSLQLSTLTHMDLTPNRILYSVIQDFARVLRQCRNLVSLRFFIVEIVQNPVVLDVIDLPCLQHLGIHEDAHLSCQLSIFANVRAPRLELLTCYPSFLVPENMAGVLSSSPYVTALSLSRTRASTLVGVVQSCPNLTTFYITYIQFDGNSISPELLLARFVHGNAEHVLCPRLQYFRIGVSIPIKDVGALRSFIMQKMEWSPHLARWRKLSLPVTLSNANSDAISILSKQLDTSRVTLDVTYSVPEEAFAACLSIHEIPSRGNSLWSFSGMPKF